MKVKRSIGREMRKLETLLAIAVAGLFVQLVPGLFRNVTWLLDVRNWSRGMWIAVNVFAILALIGIRCRAELSRVLAGAFASRRDLCPAARDPDGGVGTDSDYEVRTRRDAEWRERAIKRLPFT